MRKIGTALALGAALFAQPGVAGPLDGASVGPPAVLPGVSDRDFSGFYGALSFGALDGSLASPPLTSGLETGQTLGVVGGYNWQRGALVYGGEVRFLTASGADWPAGGGNEAYDALYDLRGRAGYSAGDVLVYGALGISWGTGTPSAPAPVDTDGVTFGIGVEMNLTERLFLGADLSRRDLSGTSGFGAEVDTFSLRGGLRF